MSGLYLNYCFCTVTSDIEDVFSINYQTNDQLKQLRANNKDFSFYREGDKILYWSRKQGTNKVIEQLNPCKIQIMRTSHPKIIIKMIEDKLYTILDETNQYDLYFEKYAHTLVAKKKTAEYSDDALEIKACAKFSPYYFWEGDDLYFGISVSGCLSHSFKWDKKQFADNGIDASGLFENRMGTVAANTRAITRYKEAKGLTEQLDKLKNDFEDKNNEFQFINRIMNWLQKKMTGKIYKNIEITDCYINYLPYANVFNSEIISSPKRYYANDKYVSGKPSSALESVGPYKAQQNNSIIKISLVSLKDNEGMLNRFTKNLSEKLKKLFKLDAEYTNVWVEKDTAQGFNDAILPINAKSADVVVFIVRKEQENMPTKHSPYYQCKAKLIGQEIPTQCVCIETIKRMNDFIMNNIALNIYAKFGGTAWGIEKQDTTKKELIIGIGSTLNAEKKQVMSIANVFDNSGVYLAGSCNPIIDYNCYTDELEKLLKALFETVLVGEKNAHLIFHIFKSASKNREIKALENVIRHFADINITYAFVHLGYGHNFRLYYNDGNGDLKKGQYIRLNKSESLLIVNDKSTTPLKLTIDSRSTFRDIYYITQQAFAFAHLSERSFTPSKKPITIMYPSIMASLIEKLKYVEKWDQDKLKVKGVTEKLWFL